MTTKPWREISAPLRQNPDAAARIEEQKRALRDALALTELRERRGQTQRDLAARIAVSQGRVSKLERQHDIYLSTLQAYVEALGGRLEVDAVFPDERVHLISSR